MSDDEDLIYKKPQKAIHYGTLDHSDWIKQQNTLEEIQSDEDDYEPDSKRLAVQLGSSNIHLSGDYLELEQDV